ncbi:hypothetical protein ACFSM5_02960 [Lacibacterium aquatile]|uniref:Lipoprotein n=1 Tax=Lacibacterium aquatile TaxID=1168082 RepID=A0ABW5DQL8_9PROT
MNVLSLELAYRHTIRQDRGAQARASHGQLESIERVYLLQFHLVIRKMRPHFPPGWDEAPRQERGSRMNGFGRCVALTFGILALAGCSSGAPPSEQGGLACPDVSILAEASRLTQWKPGTGRDLTDVISNSEMMQVTGTCDFPSRSNKVLVQFAIAIRAESGPANPSHTADIPYFIALVDKNRKVVVRERFSSQVTFPANQARIGFYDEFEHQFALPNGARAQDYAYFVGFEMSEEELQRNRARLGN